MYIKNIGEIENCRKARRNKSTETDVKKDGKWRLVNTLRKLNENVVQYKCGTHGDKSLSFYPLFPYHIQLIYVYIYKPKYLRILCAA